MKDRYEVYGIPVVYFDTFSAAREEAEKRVKDQNNKIQRDEFGEIIIHDRRRNSPSFWRLRLVGGSPQIATVRYDGKVDAK